MDPEGLRHAKAEAHEFSRRTDTLLAEAKRLCAETPDCDLEQWMGLAKHRGMTWVEGLDWVTRMLHNL